MGGPRADLNANPSFHTGPPMLYARLSPCALAAAVRLRRQSADDARADIWAHHPEVRRILDLPAPAGCDGACRLGWVPLIRRFKIRRGSLVTAQAQRDERHQVVVAAGQQLQQNWRDLQPGDELARRLGRDIGVIVENDANLAVLGEARFGAGQGASDLVYVKVASGIGAGIIPGGMEMMDKPAIHAAEAFVHAGYPLDVEALLIIELDGPGVEVDELIRRVETIALACGSTTCQISNSEAERNLFWAGRKAAFPAVQANAWSLYGTPFCWETRLKISRYSS